ncbi:MAG: hypothetical protein WC120_03060 [Parcubacteria group bacterium]
MVYDLEPLDDSQIAEAIELFLKEFVRHKSGLFIVAPSGAGKTYFVDRQKDKNWIDGDKLWEKSGAHPKRAWWLESEDVMDEIDRRSDEVTKRAIEKGLWIMGASNNWLRPDAVVVPEWEKHKSFIKKREETNYDGGATSDRLGQVMGHRNWISKWKEKGVPIFDSIEEAADYLAKDINK